MRIIFAAVALSIALPAMANAQAPAPAEAKKCCCKDMGGGDKSHAGHDMKPSTDAPNNRQ